VRNLATVGALIVTGLLAIDRQSLKLKISTVKVLYANTV
jgi:hypothetical protein